MRKLILLSALFFSFGFSGNAQEETQLIEVLKGSGDLLQEVTTKSYTFDQQLSWDETLPYKLSYTQNKEGKRGTESTTYEFSLKDIDLNTIRVQDQRDMMVVRFFIDNRQKLIRVFEEDEQQKYIYELEMMAVDADNGRAIQTFLKEAAELAAKIELVCAPVTQEDKLDWLKKNIKTFSINETTYDQAFTVDKSNAAMVAYTLAERGKKTVEHHWKLNLADLDAKKVNLKISNTEVFIEVPTKKNLKYIYYEKDGTQGNYASTVKFMVDDFDQAKCMLTILSEVIKESEHVDKKGYPEISSLEQGLDLLVENVGEVASGGNKISQEIKAACVNELSITKTSSKGDPVEEVSKFNLSDVQDKTIDINVRGKSISVDLNTGKDKLVQPFKNGEMMNYDSDISIMANSPENAKMLAYILPEIVKSCKEQPPFEAKGSAQGNLEWIQEQLAGVAIEGLDQSLEMMEGDECKWQFKLIEQGKKEDKEEIFEFNLIDLDEKGIKFKITGKNLFVEVNTQKGEKNIKYYENGEPDDYQDSFLIRMNNVEDARKLISVMQQSIKLCKEAE
jgi:hypothetical protein